MVFFGDSITDFWRLNEYFPGKDYVNRGISGQVTSEMLGRMKEDVIDLRPKAMILLAGTNDLARGHRVEHHREQPHDDYGTRAGPQYQGAAVLHPAGQRLSQDRKPAL